VREAPVTAEELDTIKRNIIETFPSSFASKGQAVGVFAADEYTRRDPTFWQSYRERIRALTPADIQRVAQKHLVLDKMVVLVVGDQKEIDLGDGKHETSLAALAAGRPVVTLPLRDPLTMKRP
jgi:zinc protease